ncbi:hypothetical protein [Mycobacterium sp. URHB0021]
MTATPNVPMPTGAVRVEEWEGEGHDRGRFFLHPPLEVSDVTVAIRGVQYSDGKMGRSALLQLHPSVESIGADFTPRYARRLAAMPQNLADTCEILDEAGQ